MKERCVLDESMTASDPRLRRSWRIGALPRWFLSVPFLAALLALAMWRLSNPLPSLEEVRRWADTRQWSRADTAMGRLVARRPHDAEVLLMAARVAAGRGDLERCWSILNRVPERSPLKPEALTREAQAAQSLHHARRAEAAWSKLLELTESRPELATFRLTAQAELVSLFSLERRVAEAQAVLWQMYPDHSERWRLLIGLARIKAHGAPSQEAMQILQQIVLQDPDDFNARRALAICSAETLQWERAIELITSGPELERGDDQSREILLECYLRQQQWDAMDALIAELDLKSAGPKTLRLCSERYENAGQWDKAESYYRRALESDDWDHTTHYRLGQLLQRRGQTEYAQQHMAKFHDLKKHRDALADFVAKYPQSAPEAWSAPEPATCLEISGNCAALGRLDEARAWLREALRQEPHWPAAVDALKQLQ
jgi:tetratricopeptide (TPR) repeat protein